MGYFGIQRPQVKDFPGGIHTRAPPPDSAARPDSRQIRGFVAVFRSSKPLTRGSNIHRGKEAQLCITHKKNSQGRRGIQHDATCLCEKIFAKEACVPGPRNRKVYPGLGQFSDTVGEFCLISYTFERGDQVL
jgi:hypothetical protein